VLKRGDILKLDIALHTNGTAAPLQEGFTLRAILKTKPGPQPVLALVEEWTTGTHATLPGSIPIYSASLNLDGEALDTLLGSSASATAYFEITFTDSDGGPTTSRLMAVTIENDLYRGDETAPPGTPSPDASYLNFTIPQELTAEQKTQKLADLGLSEGGISIIRDTNGLSWLALWDISDEAFIPVALSSAGGERTLVYLDPAAAPFV
jgi:hypothetical protein